MRKQSVYCIDFTVEGSGDFPLDMLRYDCAAPADDEAVRHIAMTYDAANQSGTSHPERRRVNLLMHSVHGIGPTVARWASFGWRVVEH